MDNQGGLIVAGIILLFIMSAIAWMNGDDSMSWLVIGGVIFIVIAMIMGSCSA